MARSKPYMVHYRPGRGPRVLGLTVSFSISFIISIGSGWTRHLHVRLPGLFSSVHRALWKACASVPQQDTLVSRQDGGLHEVRLAHLVESGALRVRCVLTKTTRAIEENGSMQWLIESALVAARSVKQLVVEVGRVDDGEDRRKQFELLSQAAVAVEAELVKLKELFSEADDLRI